MPPAAVASPAGPYPSWGLWTIDNDAVLNGTLSEMRGDIKSLQGSMEGDAGIRVRLATLETTVGNNATASGERHTATQDKIESLEGKVEKLGGKVDDVAKSLGAKLDALAAAKNSSGLFDLVKPQTVAGVILALASMLGIGMGVHASNAPADPPPAITSGAAP